MYSIPNMLLCSPGPRFSPLPFFPIPVLVPLLRWQLLCGLGVWLVLLQGAISMWWGPVRHPKPPKHLHTVNMWSLRTVFDIGGECWLSWVAVSIWWRESFTSTFKKFNLWHNFTLRSGLTSLSTTWNARMWEESSCVHLSLQGCTP